MALSSLAQNIKRLRMQRGWSQQMLAAHANVSVQTVNNIESGRVWWPQSATVWKVARALGTHPETLGKPFTEEVENWQLHLTSVRPQTLSC